MKEGFSVTIRTEEKSELNIGVFDVTIRVGDPCLICRNGKEKVRLEVETRLGRRHRVSLKVNPRATVRTQAVTSFSGGVDSLPAPPGSPDFARRTLSLTRETIPLTRPSSSRVLARWYCLQHPFLR